MGVIKKIIKHGWLESKYIVSKRMYEMYSKKMLFSNKYVFDNRTKNAENMLLIIAGYQEYYWDTVLHKVKKNEVMFEEKIDVCICVPGANGEKLRQVCQKNNWSYLWIKEDKLSLVQNIAIQLFPRAEWIYKIDEDIILSDNYFAKMKAAYVRSEEDDACNMQVGFVAPLININAFGAKPFLKTISKYDEYISKFGELQVGLKEPIHMSKEVAKWIWQQSIPFDKVAEIVENENKEKIAVCPHRFSIGAILFKRSFWDDLGAFVVDLEMAMGVEERQVCAFCMNEMRGIYIAMDTFVGHLGFQYQKQEVKEFFIDNIKDI